MEQQSLSITQLNPVRSYSLSREQIIVLLENKLKPLLPHSLPLYRRCQFHLRSASAQVDEVLLADKVTPLAAARAEVCVCIPQPATQASAAQQSADAHTSNRAHLDQWLSSPESQDRTSSFPVSSDWLATHIDLSNTGETQVWLFASWEPSCYGITRAENAISKPSHATTKSSAVLPVRTTLFQVLYTHLRRLHVPYLPTKPTEKWRKIHDTGKIITLPYRRSKILFGTIHASLLPYFEEDVVQTSNKVLSAVSLADHEDKNRGPKQSPVRDNTLYLKYLVPMPVQTSIDTSQQETKKDSPANTTPDGFHFGPLTPTHLQLMLDRTVIPRTLETVKSLVSVGLFRNENAAPDEEPIAWGLLGKDASVSSLHTEAEHRGKGIAEYIAKELIRLQDQTFRSDTPASRASHSVNSEHVVLAHSDVSTTNKASQRVFEKLGGRVGWEVAWVEIDVGEEVTHSE